MFLRNNFPTFRSNPAANGRHSVWHGTCHDPPHVSAYPFRTVESGGSRLAVYEEIGGRDASTGATGERRRN